MGKRAEKDQLKEKILAMIASLPESKQVELWNELKEKRVTK